MHARQEDPWAVGMATLGLGFAVKEMPAENTMKNKENTKSLVAALTSRPRFQVVASGDRSIECRVSQCLFVVGSAPEGFMFQVEVPGIPRGPGAWHQTSQFPSSKCLGPMTRCFQVSRGSYDSTATTLQPAVSNWKIRLFLAQLTY
jgi:hypothetical protein